MKALEASSLESMPEDERLLLERRLLEGRKARPRAEAIRKRRDAGPCPLSFAQSRLWLAERMNPVPGQYNIPRAFRIAGPLDVDALRSAFDALVERHEALRTRFVFRDGLPQQVLAPHEPFALRRLDLRQGPSETREAACDAFVRELSGAAFDLANDVPIRAGLVRLGDRDHVLVMTLHHIVADGWSLGVLDRELHHFYAAQRRGEEATLAPLALQYADFSEWQRDAFRGSALDAHVGFWRRQLAGLAALELPADRPRPLQASTRGSKECIDVPPALASALKDLGRKHNATLYMTLLAAFQVLLMRHSGQEDIAVGSPIAGRGRPELDGLIGFFVNTLVMRGDLTGNPPFSELLERTRGRAIDAFAHQDLPFEKLVEELNPERDFRRNPLFQVMFTLQGAGDSSLRLPGLDLTRVPIETVTSKFDLTLHMTEADGRLGGGFEYNTDLYDASTIRRMGGHWLQLLAGIVADPECRIGSLPLLTDAERRQLLVEWNRTASDYPAERTVPALFEAHVAANPQAVALVDMDLELTYGELNARANRLAHRLRELGAGAGDPIGVAMERSAELVVAMLGILKAGGAYVPLDPDYPAERLAFMLRDTALRILVTRDAHLPQLPRFDGRVVCLDRDAGELDRCDADNPPSAGTGDSLAYIIYTSGSTGEPKGVPVPHRGIARLVCRTNYIAIDATERIAHLSNPSFDAATFEIWGALLNGARVVVLRRDVALDPKRLESRLIRDGVTALFVTTALFNAIVQSMPSAFAGLKTVLFGGEAVDPRRVRECIEAGPPSRLLHVYGPTETVTFATWHEVGAVAPDERTLPIGRPVANLRLAVLDRHRQPVPVGVAGELCIGGDGIAQGYWRRPELTDDRFIAGVEGAPRGTRMYRTGDLVRYRPDGNLEFLGRLDQQLKLRGHRIEPGEIEAVLRGAAAQSAALVMLREDSPGQRELVAYVVAGTGGPAPTAAGLRALLKSKLPEYMLPSAFVLLPALPLTPNGKVDRSALPPPATVNAPRESTFVAPRDNVEQQLVRIWEELLQRQSIGVRDNFFDLGGHSLLAVQLMKRIDVAFNRTLALDLLWSTDGTVEALAKVLRDGFRAGDNPELIPIKAGTRRPLFVMFTIAGRLFFYYELARRLAPEQAVYGLQARGVLDAGRPDSSIPSIAAHCIETMRRVQPDGPYLLAGYSAGGVVAYEVAQQLTAAGQKVELLALLDTFAPPATMMARCRGELRSLLRGKVDRWQLKEFACFAALHSLSLDRLRQLRTVAEAHRWAHWSYRPAPSSTPIELFVAEKSAARAIADRLGWTRWAKGPIRVHRLPGSHTDLVKPPVVDDLAARLQACIDDAAPD